MSFAQNLKYIKEKENLTNYRLAKLFGCSQSSLINWLDNGVVPHPKTRQKIADHFGITLAELDGDELPVLPEKGAKESTLDPKTEGEGLSAARQKLYDAIANLTDEQCTKLLGVVEWAKENK
jgi:transcriptional regulator with XRE-family HTH domain